ncbi:hypothetical protein B9Z55_007351 [Caenorhabditis nigoni]|uniref:Uncharacterized protein n=1 Tax=Caenorhabditis nigoni TaxID=1611254 RepID=A0A2G5V981_9PELO|nr:hypothetical protein B9Z55_007351 [Caenorhabditis nigoni]
MSFPSSPEPPTEAETSATGNIENSDENLSEKPESSRQDPKAEKNQNSKNQDGPEAREESSEAQEAPEPPVNPPARGKVSTSKKYKILKAHFLSTSPRWSPSFSISPAPPAPEVPEDSKSPPATPTLIPIGPSRAPLASMFPTHRGISMRNGKPARAEQSQEASHGEPDSGESSTAQRDAQTTMQNLARTLGQMSLKPREFAIPVRRRDRNLASTGFNVQGSSAFTGAESEKLAPGPSEPSGSDPPLVRAKTPDYSNIRFYPFAPGMFLYANPPPIKPQTRFENHQYLVPAKPLFSEPAPLSAVAPATFNAPLNRNQSGQGPDLPANTPISSPAHPLNPPDVLEDEPRIPAYNQDFGEDDGFQIPGHGLPPVLMPSIHQPDPTVDWQGSYYELQAENIRLNLYLHRQVLLGKEQEEYLDNSMDLNRIHKDKIEKLEAEIESLKNNCGGWRLYDKLQVVHSKHLKKFAKLESDYKAALKKLEGSRNELKDQEEEAKKIGVVIEEEKGTESADIREQQMRTISELIKEVNDMKMSRDSKESEKELAKLKRQTIETVESVKSQMENLKEELAFVEDSFNTLETCKKEIDEQIKNSQKLIDEALNVVIKDEDVHEQG